jgi:hypothetical protein
MTDVIPMGRGGQPAGVAAGIAHLASGDASFVTGLGTSTAVICC